LGSIFCRIFNFLVFIMENLLHTLQNFASSHIELGLLITFVWMIIANIVPITFVLYPDIFVFLGIFLATKFLSWWIPWLILIFAALIGEIISYFIWYKYWVKVLEKDFFQKENVKPWIEKLRNNQIKTLIIGKMLPGVVRFIPILAGAIKMDFKKFLIYDFLMIVYGISYLFLVWIVGLKVALHFFWEKVWYIFPILVIGYLVWEYYKNRKTK